MKVMTFTKGRNGMRGVYRRGKKNKKINGMANGMKTENRVIDLTVIVLMTVCDDYA